jgi:hypothetical protein
VSDFEVGKSTLLDFWITLDSKETICWIILARMKLVAIVFLMLAAQFGRSQTVADNWYFGFNAGIQFQNNIPSAIFDGQTQGG